MRVRWLFVGAMLAGLLPWSAVVAEATLTIEQYDRVDFNERPGSPPSYEYMQPDANGLLWVLSSGRLFRFDGMRFEEFRPLGDTEPLGERLRVIEPDPVDGIWIGYVGGRAARVHKERITRYDAESGLPAGAQVTSFAFRQGRVIAGTAVGLFELFGDQWRAVRVHAQLAGAFIDSVQFDPAGALWVKSPGFVFRRGAGEDTFSVMELPAGDSLMTGLQVGPDGTPWVWNLSANALCRIRADRTFACWHAPGIINPLFDRQGNLWWADDHIVYRVPNALTLEDDDRNALTKRMESIEGSLSRAIESLDGSIWLSGSNALRRLREPTVERMPLPHGGLLSGPRGEVWILSFVRGLMRAGTATHAHGPLQQAEDGSQWAPGAIPPDAPTQYEPVSGDAHPIAVLERHMTGLHSSVRMDRMANGEVFIARLSPPAILRRQNHTFEEIGLPALDRGAVIRRLQQGTDGRLWISLSRNKVPAYALQGTEWHAYGGHTAPQALGLVSLGVGPDRRLWLAGSNELWALNGAHTERYDAEQGLDLGVPRDIEQLGQHMWVTGSRGVAIFVRGRFVGLVGNDGDRFQGVTGILQDAAGDVYLNGIDGITRIRHQHWQRVLGGASATVPYSRLGRWDGVQWPPGNMPSPTVARSPDGTMWFTRQGGLLRMRAGAMGSPGPAPKVLMSSLTVDEKPTPTDHSVVLDPGIHRLTLGLLVPGAERPERTRLRYRVTKGDEEGDWVQLGSERALTFSQEGHGDYVIEIQASDRDGNWSGSPLLYAFKVKPAFHQTPLFYLLAIALLVAIAVVSYLLNVRRAAARMRGEMNARLRERERIARDLHDTLLQGMQGMLLSFRGIATRLGNDDPLRGRMESVLDRTQEVIREGRDRIHLLRDPEASTLDLSECLQRHAQELAAEHGLLCEINTPHPPRALEPHVYEELRQIGREAITNACQHSRGERVTVVLDYSDFGLLLKVQDDGVGLSEAGAKVDRHWGLRGMRERASAIGGAFTASKRAESGTEIKLFVRAERAYP